MKLGEREEVARAQRESSRLGEQAAVRDMESCRSHSREGQEGTG